MPSSPFSSKRHSPLCNNNNNNNDIKSSYETMKSLFFSLERRNSNSNSIGSGKMITRSNLVDQLREYQIRSKNDWASVSFFASTSNLNSSSRVDVVSVILELIILAFVVFSAISLYFRRMQLAVIFIFITMLLLLSMKVTKHVRLNKRKKRRMLLPLSM